MTKVAQEEIEEGQGIKCSITRRSFVKGTVLLAGAAVGGSLLNIPKALAGRGNVPITRYPIYVPPTVSPIGLTLRAAPATVNVGGRTASGWAYNGSSSVPPGPSVPGPTIRASTGTRSIITLVNGLPQETITHWHGMLVNTANDGQPPQAIQPDKTYDYDFTINQRAAMNWYHPHPHLHTGEQVARGLAGAFIVTDNEEGALGLPSGAYEVPLVVRDVSFDNAGNIDFNSGGGNNPMVNGTLNPYLDVDPALYRFRVLTGAQNRIFGLALLGALGNVAQFTLIGNDGGLLVNSVPLTRVDLSPGERADIIIDFRGLRGGSLMLKDLRTGWDLLEFRVRDITPITGTIPTALSTIETLTAPVAVTRSFKFEGMGKINGQEYVANRIDFTVPFGVVERWRFTTKGAAPHPVHIHGASFQVFSRTGGRGMVFPWERGWKDTVLLDDGETVDILIRFDAFRGDYLIHCHRLEHEDNGMMSTFSVVSVV